MAVEQLLEPAHYEYVHGLSFHAEHDAVRLVDDGVTAPSRVAQDALVYLTPAGRVLPSALRGCGAGSRR